MIQKYFHFAYDVYLIWKNYKIILLKASLPPRTGNPLKLVLTGEESVIPTEASLGNEGGQTLGTDL